MTKENIKDQDNIEKKSSEESVNIPLSFLLLIQLIIQLIMVIELNGVQFDLKSCA